MVVVEEPSQVYDEFEEILENDGIIYEKEPDDENVIARYLRKAGNEDTLPDYEELEVKGLEFLKIRGKEKFYEVNVGENEIEIGVNIRQLSDGRWALSSISSEESDFAEFLESHVGRNAF